MSLNIAKDNKQSIYRIIEETKNERLVEHSDALNSLSDFVAILLHSDALNAEDKRIIDHKYKEMLDVWEIDAQHYLDPKLEHYENNPGNTDTLKEDTNTTDKLEAEDAMSLMESIGDIMNASSDYDPTSESFINLANAYYITKDLCLEALTRVQIQYSNIQMYMTNNSVIDMLETKLGNNNYTSNSENQNNYTPIEDQVTSANNTSDHKTMDQDKNELVSDKNDSVCEDNNEDSKEDDRKSVFEDNYDEATTYYDNDTVESCSNNNMVESSTNNTVESASDGNLVESVSNVNTNTVVETAEVVKDWAEFLVQDGIAVLPKLFESGIF